MPSWTTSQMGTSAIACCVGAGHTCYLADLLRGHDEVTLLCALGEYPAYFGQPALAKAPIHLRIPSRSQIWRHLNSAGACQLQGHCVELTSQACVSRLRESAGTSAATQWRSPHLLGNEIRQLLLLCAANKLQAVCCALLQTGGQPLRSRMPGQSQGKNRDSKLIFPIVITAASCLQR